MFATFQAATPRKQSAQSTMRALVFHGPNQISIEQVSIPRPGPGEAVIRVTLTTICGTDLHILKGDVPSVTDGRILLPNPGGVVSIGLPFRAQAYIVVMALGGLAAAIWAARSTSADRILEPDR